MSEIDSSNRELEKLNAEQRVSDALFSEGEVRTKLRRAEARINELSALLYQLLEQMDNDLFSDQLTTSNRQNLIRTVKQRIKLTPEILDIVNKSKEPEQQPIS